MTKLALRGKFPSSPAYYDTNHAAATRKNHSLLVTIAESIKNIPRVDDNKPE